MSAGRRHHEHMMCGGGGAKEGRKGAVEDDISMMRIVALINHGGCHHPMATMGLHPRQ